MSDGKYYLYRHIRLDKNEPFYIGIGTKPKTYSSFEKEYNRAFDKRRNNFWSKVFNKTDYRVDILFESDDRKIIEQKEKEFIQLYGRKDLGTGTLVNLTDGGEGCTKPSLDGSKRIRESHIKTIYQYDLKGNFVKEFESLTDASNGIGDFRNISSCALGLKNTAYGFIWKYEKVDRIEVKEKIYKSKYDKVKEKKVRTKVVYQYTIDGDFVKKYNSVQEAKEKNNIGSSISLCLNGKMLTSNGYRWSFNFTDKLEKIEFNDGKFKGKPVYQYNLDGLLINTFNDIKSTAISLGVSRDKIRNHINNNTIFQNTFFKQ